MTTDTAVFGVVVDTLGEARIACGAHPANQWAVPVVEGFAHTFDEQSRSEWDSVLDVVGRRDDH